MTKPEFIAAANETGKRIVSRYSLSQLIHGDRASGHEMVNQLRADVLALTDRVGNQAIVEDALAHYVKFGPLDMSYDLGVAGDLALAVASSRGQS